MEGVRYSRLSVVHEMPKREIQSYIAASVIKHLLCAGCCVRKTKICLGDPQIIRVDRVVWRELSITLKDGEGMEIRREGMFRS